MSQGSAPRQADLFRDTASFVEPLVRSDSIHALLARECGALFPDELFGDLFATGVGRRSVPPMIVAVVMVLQRLEGLSDRKAVERYTFDARWKDAAGGQPFDAPGFAHTVLVDMRARLARSDRSNGIFERTLEVARGAGLLGVRRVLDSTPLYDAVATMDTVTLVRSAIRGVLAASGGREPGLRAVLRRDDDYRTSGKPQADWDDADARAALVDALARDGEAALAALEGEPLPAPLAEAATLLATVLGQDLEDGPDGRIRIARKVATDRVISTVDPDTRHGHKTQAHKMQLLARALRRFATRYEWPGSSEPQALAASIEQQVGLGIDYLAPTGKWELAGAALLHEMCAPHDEQSTRLAGPMFALMDGSLDEARFGELLSKTRATDPSAPRLTDPRIGSTWKCACGSARHTDGLERTPELRGTRPALTR